MRNIFRFLGMIALTTLVAMAPPFAARGASQDTRTSRFAILVAPQQAAMLKHEEDLVLERAEGTVREMLALAKTKPEKELANDDAQIVAEIRHLIVRRQAVRSLANDPRAAI